MRAVSHDSMQHPSRWTRPPRSVQALVLACLFSLPALASTAPDEARSEALPGSSQAPAAGVLAAVKGTVWVDRVGQEKSLTGTIGMRLQPGDEVRTEADSSASVWVPGGVVIFRVPPENRIEIGQDTTRVANQEKHARRASRSLEILEEGIWVLSSSEGSVLLGAMRGGSQDPALDENAPWLLSPRHEVITDAHPVFIWRATPQPVRVVLSLNKNIVWRSKPSAASFVRYPARAPALEPSDQYEWWLQDGHTGEALGEIVAFRRGEESIMNAIEVFEEEMSSIAEGPDGVMVKAYLQCAFYERIQAWSRVLQASTELQALQGGYSEPAEKAAAWARISMGLAPAQVEMLRQVWQSTESH